MANRPVIKSDVPIILMPYPNGGWVMHEDGIVGSGIKPKEIAAYTNTSDMLEELSAILVPDGD